MGLISNFVGPPCSWANLVLIVMRTARGRSLAAADTVLRRAGRARLSRIHITDNGLPAITDVDVLDADILLAAAAKPSKNLDLGCIGPQQPRRSGSKRRHPLLVPLPTPEPSQNRHSSRVRAGHLDCQCTLDLILRGGGLNHGKRSV